MAVDILLEGVSYIAGSLPGTWMVDLQSVSVDLDIALQQPRASFVVRIWDQAIPRPMAGNEAVFLGNAGEREFGGILAQVEETEIEPTIMEYRCTCADYTKWFDRHLVRDTFQAQTAGALIQSIVATYVNTPGNSRTFTTNNVAANSPVVPLMQWVYMAPSQVVGQLAQMTGWGFYIDDYRDVHFYPTQQFQSPLPLNTLDADDLYSNPTQAGGTGEGVYPDWIDLDISEDVSQIKNRCFVTGIYVASQSLFQETKLGDGVTTVFTMGYQAPNDVTKITVSVGGTPYQIGLDFINSTPGGTCQDNVAYVNFTQQTIRFCTAPANGAQIVVAYYPMLQTAVMQENTQAQALMAARDGTDGIYEYNRMDPSLSAELPALANQRALMTLYKYAYPYMSLHFRSYLQGWRRGQWFYLSSARRWDGAYQSANGTQKPFYVTRVQKRIIQAIAGVWTWTYDVDAASVPFEI